jgi:ADP-heptose:LPS heptosyltransferase
MRVLLIKTSSLGDVVHNLPVVTDLRARFPAAEIDWVVEESFADIPRLHPGVTPGHHGRRQALAPLAAWHLQSGAKSAPCADAFAPAATISPSTPRACSRVP